MKRSMVPLMAVVALSLALGQPARADDDPFAAGEDALAVNDSDGSASLRAKKKLKKMEPDMVLIKVTGLDDSKYPHCVMVGKVLKAAKAKKKHLKLIGKGKVYKFAPVLKMKGKWPDLSHEMTQNNLGACYYGKKTKLVVKVTGVDLKSKVFKAAQIYLK